ncbi:MAG TPA: ParB/RepB/Spo0J family partition protein [Bacilli bacterium]|nr:ParB/RepB/Spo0J family partition protein [Bacilli bacterium]
MENKKKALGKGLEQLFSNERIDFNNFEQKIYETTKEEDIVSIPIEEIRSNPYQPRKNFDSEALSELSESIKVHGVVQPIIVKRSLKGYELIAGERRTKASKLAGLTTIPAIIRDFNDDEMMEIALVENIQRENLNAIEEAECYLKIINNKHITQDEIAKRFGKSRSYITNLLGILSLPDEVKEMVISKKLSMAHARNLSKLQDSNLQIELAKKVLKDGMSVRELEKIVNSENLEKKVKIKRVSNINPKYKLYEQVFSDKTGSKVSIKNNKVEVYFDSEKDLERILEILNITIE